MIRTESSISFLEAQLREIDDLLKYCTNSNTYNSRRNSILEKLEYQYIRSKFNDHKNTIKIMSKA